MAESASIAPYSLLPQIIFEDWCLMCTATARRTTKEAICLDWQNNNFARESGSFVPLFAAELSYSPWVNCKKNCHQLTWNTRDKVWGRANSLFQCLFCSRRRRCCLSSLLSTFKIHFKMTPGFKRRLDCQSLFGNEPKLILWTHIN